jgi:protein MpaA
MNCFVFGETAGALPVLGYRFEGDGPNVLILGGVHGNEVEGVWCAHGLMKQFTQNYPFALHLTIVPMLNLDGVLARERRNSRMVDLNRNMPTKDWTSVVATERYNPGAAPASEPETRALMKFLEDERPQLIISLHSWEPMLNVNGDCLPEAEAIARLTGYRIDESIGYPTPGCLGSYAGLERDMPTLTYEIERGLAQAQVLQTHVPAVCEALKVAATPARRRK